MSSILEALRKLEDEKAARRGVAGNLAGRVVKTGRRERRNSALLLAGGMLAVAAVSVLVTWLAMKGPSLRRDGGPLPQAVEHVSPFPAATDTPSRQGAGQPAPAANGASKGTPSTAATALPGKNPGSAAARKRPSPASLSGASSAPEKPAPASPLPSLTVTGIAWQKENVNRMAVVNATPVREDTVVEGALVKEILPDRVRFSFNGKEFDVPLGK